MGNSRWINAELIDTSPNGIGISLLTLLQPGSTIVVRGHFGEYGSDVQRRAEVIWCVEAANGAFRAGLKFLDPATGRQQTASIDPEERCVSTGMRHRA